jgi:probable HAF family extracellular repeat protein
MTDLGTLGGASSQAFGINASGQVVGSSDVAGFEQHAFVTGANGIGMTDLNSLVTLGEGDYFTNATGVNDFGQIVANSYMGHAYLLSVAAVPEAKTYALMLAGLGLMGAFARRRQLSRTTAQP